MDAIASNNLKEGKRDFAGYYQIPYQTLIEMVIYIDEKTRVKSQDMKEAAKNLDASASPNGEYSFYHSNFEDGKVISNEYENLVLEDKNQRWGY